jgi:carboxylesterase
MLFELPVPGFGTVFRIATVAVGVVATIPTRTRDLRSRPAPALNYASAIALASSQQALDDSIAVPQGRSILLTHGHRVERAVVLFHGFTDSPRQFAEFADSLYAAGDNVYVPRLPHHAERGGDVSRLARVTAEGLRDLADASVDIAAGLGDSITVVGLSAGATVAAWIAQNRREVQRVVLIAPAFQVTHVPSFFERALVNLGSRGPNVTRRAAADTAQPDLAPGVATKGVAQVFRLGIAVRRSAEVLPPLAKEMLFLLNENDRTVKAAPSLDLAKEWVRNGASVTVYEFPDSLHLPHNVMEAARRGGNATVVMPSLGALAHGAPPPLWAAQRRVLLGTH